MIMLGRIRRNLTRNPLFRREIVIPTESFDDERNGLIDHTDMVKIAKAVFKFDMNSPTTEIPEFPIKGILYGKEGRIILPMILQSKQNRIKTLAVYNTGSPRVCLNVEHTLKSLDIEGKDVLPNINLNVHGLFTAISPNFDPINKDINIIGQDYLLEKALNIDIDGLGRIVTIKEYTHEEVNAFQSGVDQTL